MEIIEKLKQQIADRDQLLAIKSKSVEDLQYWVEALMTENWEYANSEPFKVIKALKIEVFHLKSELSVYRENDTSFDDILEQVAKEFPERGLEVTQ